MKITGLHTKPTMVVTNCEVKTDEEIIKLLSDFALKEGYVEAIFIDKILEREKSHPTGLPTKVHIAIPHVEDGCLESFFSVAIPQKPIKFASMDGSDEPIMAKMVFLFGITDTSQQTEVLKKFSKIFQDEELLLELVETKDSSKLLSKLKELLGDFLIL